MNKWSHKHQKLWITKQGGGSHYPWLVIKRKADILETLGQWDNAENLYCRNLEMSERFGDRIHLALSQNDLGWMLTNKGRPDQARTMLEEAYKTFKEAEHSYGLARCCNFLGTLHYRQGQYQKAIEYYNTDLELSVTSNDQEAVCALYGNLGIVYYELGELDKALDHYRKQIELSKKVGNTANICNGMGNMASIYMDQGDYQKALECSNIQLTMATQMGELNSIAVASNNIGDCCLKQGHFLEAKEYFEKQLIISKKLGDKFLESVAYGDLGQVFQALGRNKEALENYSLAIDIQSKLEIKYYLCYYLIFRAGLYHELKQPDQALADTTAGKAIAIEIGREEMIFKARLLEALLTAEENQSEAEAALTGLLAENQDGKRRFEILHHLHRITAKPAYKEQARELIKASDTATWPHSLRRLAGELE
ncbi:tetratricopeptide repeat protein [candidate division TA06 bacterium]|nr:tetratricopeptide repeat protein [candidate division TA06 bacterium]